MIRDIPLDEIKETIENPDQKDIFINVSSGTYNMYLKNFDYYYVFCLGIDLNSSPRIDIKLPTKFVEQHGLDLNHLLEEFLKIVGVVGIMGDKSSIMIKELSHDEITVHLGPQTLHDTVFFSCRDDDVTRNLFGITKSKHNKMLKEYEVRK